jgi:hypothetical protein
LFDSAQVKRRLRAFLEKRSVCCRGRVFVEERSCGRAGGVFHASLTKIGHRYCETSLAAGRQIHVERKPRDRERKTPATARKPLRDVEPLSA